MKSYSEIRNVKDSIYGIKLNLRSLDLNIAYTRGIDDPINDFIIPCLNNSNFLKLISGFFSSKVFITLFTGIKHFILENGGEINLIAGFLYKEDFDICNMTDEELSSFINSEIEKDILSKESMKRNDHLKLLGWLLKQKRLEIKLGIPVDKNGKLMKEYAILHEKIGIFHDNNGNIVSFSGSPNITYNAWLNNREEFKVFTSWGESSKYCYHDLKKFTNYWEEFGDEMLRIINFPIPVRKKIEKLAPENPIEIDFAEIDRIYLQEWMKTTVTQISIKLDEKSAWRYKKGYLKPEIELIKPFPHQKKAIEYLSVNRYLGFLSMATGTGKTKAAILASYRLYKELLKKSRPLLVVIIVPEIYLVNQWYKELIDYSTNVIACHSKSKWKENIENALKSLVFGLNDHFYVIATPNSLNLDWWIRIAEIVEGNAEILFIGDEAHSLGSPERLFILKRINPTYRIGLSATPQRYIETETEKLLNWFFLDGKIKLFNFDIKKAQKLGRLMRFSYKIYKSYLLDEEFRQFIESTKQIARASVNADKDEKSAKFFSLLLNERADIIKKSLSKIQLIHDLILDLIKSHKFVRTVIFCKDNDQISLIKEIVERTRKKFPLEIKHNIVVETISGKDELTERKEKIDWLISKRINALFAMKVLNQGVDIPLLERAIFISSSGSLTEHIQRAGRILRVHKSKPEIVEIIDFVIEPSDDQILKDLNSAKKIIEIETSRVEFFAEYAENHFELNNWIIKQKNRILPKI